ncbi:MAG TPA: preprotein translocase subunit SecG [Chloroflexota bacterium]|jgi:preprotein translocase subunit SecG|nr:preprotein translocase subunit SecG [Chloroflexota bacterium]
MQGYLNVLQIVVSAALIALVLMQSRGSGFTGTSQDQTTVFRTRRGIEKTIFQFTLFMAAVFVIVSIASVLIAARV